MRVVFALNERPILTYAFTYIAALLLRSPRAVAVRQSEASKPPTGASATKRKSASLAPTDFSAGKPRAVQKLKGVIVKRKTSTTKHIVVTKERANVSDNSLHADKLGEREAKRRRTDDTGEEQVS